MPSENSITIVVAALNEEGNLAHAVEIAVGAVEHWFDEYEILIFNDGSTDRTGAIADEIAAANPRVRAVHHDHPHCLGGVISEGYEQARMNYVLWIDGKGATTREALDTLFSRKGQADLVISYPLNDDERSLRRRMVSWTYRTLFQTLFGLRLRYLNAPSMTRAELVRQFSIRTRSYGWQTEALIKMIRSGCTYVEVGIVDRHDNAGRRTKAFRLNNVIGIMTLLVRMLWEVYVRRDYRKVRPVPAGSPDDSQRGQQ